MQTRKVAVARQETDAGCAFVIPGEGKAFADHGPIESHRQVEDDDPRCGKRHVVDHRAVRRGDVGDSPRVAVAVHNQIAQRLKARLIGQDVKLARCRIESDRFRIHSLASRVMAGYRARHLRDHRGARFLFSRHRRCRPVADETLVMPTKVLIRT